MAASDDPNFLSAAAEGGIGGLAGYQSAMERAAERQGEVTSEMSDLIIAREANDLRRQAAQASATQQQVVNFIDTLEAEQKNLAENWSMMSEEQRAEAQQRIDNLRATVNGLLYDEQTEKNEQYDNPPEQYVTD